MTHALTPIFSPGKVFPALCADGTLVNPAFLNRGSCGRAG